MATVLELAFLSNDVYVCDSGPKHPFLANWNRMIPTSDEAKPPSVPDGFFARLYCNHLTAETVIAYRGTVLTKKEDLIADAELAGQHWNQQNDYAINFYIWAKKFLLSKSFTKLPILTGHSLGGYLAQIVATEFVGIIAVVFNAPGIGGVIASDQHIYKIKNNFNIYNYNLNADLIHRVGHRIGTETILYDHSIYSIYSTNILQPAEMIFDGYCAYKEHSIATVISVLENNAQVAERNFQ